MGLSGYRLGTGSIALASFTDTYAIESFPVQADQGGRKWIRPDNEADIVEQAEELVVGMSQFVGSYGYVNFTWRLRVLTPLMVKYILDTFFSGSDFNADVTVRTFNRASNAWVTYWAVAQRQLYREGATPAAGGYDEFVIDFVKCEVAT
jgi:hypothetical protein